MSCFQFQLHKISNFSSTNFLQLYLNVKKLKYSQLTVRLKCSKAINPQKQILSSRSFVNFIVNKPFKSLLSCNRNLARCSQRFSAIDTENGRRRSRERNIRFAETVKKRIHSTKLPETKRNVAKKIGELKENILTVPNGLCLTRILATPVLAYLVLYEFYTSSLGLFIFAGFTDLVDGFIARTFPSQQSMIGSFLDPAADKLLIATLFITLTANGLIPVPLTSLIIARDACLMGAGFYIRYVSLPPPKTLSRYFDMSFVTAKLSPTLISKANTLIQLSLVAASLAAPVFHFVDHMILQMLWYVTGATTVLSACSYLYYKNATFKLFNLPDKEEKK